MEQGTIVLTECIDGTDLGMMKNQSEPQADGSVCH